MSIDSLPDELADVRVDVCYGLKAYVQLPVYVRILVFKSKQVVEVGDAVSKSVSATEKSNGQ